MSRFFATGSESESESSSCEEEQIPQKAQGITSAFTFSDEEEETKRVVRSAREKRYEEMVEIIKQIKNHKKIKDMSKLLTSFENLTRAFIKARPVIEKEESGVTPKFYVRCLVELEDFITDCWEDRESRKNMSKNNSKSLATLRQKLRKYNKDFENDIATYRENPDAEDDEREDDEEPESEDEEKPSDFLKKAPKEEKEEKVAKVVKGSEDEDSDDDSIDWGSTSEGESSLSSDDEKYGGNLANKFLKRPGEKDEQKETTKREKKRDKERKEKKKDEDDEGWEEVRGGAVIVMEKPKMFARDAEINHQVVVKKFNEIQAARGKKGTDRSEQIELLIELMNICEAHSLGDGVKLKIIFAIIAAIFDYNPNIATCMKSDVWQKCLDYIGVLLDTILENPNITVGEHISDESENIVLAPYRVKGCALTVVERMDEEFTKMLQGCDAHSPEYVERLKDEKAVCQIIERLQNYLESRGTPSELCRIYLRRIEHLYYKFDPSVFKRKEENLLISDFLEQNLILSNVIPNGLFRGKPDREKERPDSKGKKKLDSKEVEKQHSKEKEKLDSKKEEKLDSKKEEKLDSKKKEEKLDSKKEEKLDSKKEEKLDSKKEEKLDSKAEEKLDSEAEEKLESKAEEKPDSSKEEKAGSEEEKAGREEEKAGSEEQKASSEEEKAGSEEEKAGSEEEKAGSEEETAGSEEGEEIEEETSIELMAKLCKFIYAKDNTDRIRTQAMLFHIYHHALHDNWFQARDLMLMSHLQDTIHHSDVSTQILYNRALVQLGLCSFRHGNIKDAHNALLDIQSGGRAKELLAQGLLPQRQHERTPEQEKIEKRRQVPFHKHINLELLECVYLVSAMLLEIPYMAAHELEGRKRMISKSFHHQLRNSERQPLVGPPESMREHVVAASKAMRVGNWRFCKNFIINEKMNSKVWDLFHQADKVREMICRKIQEEALRTYLFTYSGVYDSLSVNTLSEMFELDKSIVHSIISKMIISEELMASLDEPTQAVIMHRTEPSRIQALSLQLADKVASLVDQNERLWELKQGSYFGRSIGQQGNYRDSSYQKNYGQQDRGWARRTGQRNY